MFDINCHESHFMSFFPETKIHYFLLRADKLKRKELFLSFSVALLYACQKILHLSIKLSEYRIKQILRSESFLVMQTWNLREWAPENVLSLFTTIAWNLRYFRNCWARNNFRVIIYDLNWAFITIFLYFARFQLILSFWVLTSSGISPWSQARDVARSRN